jgi:hypothetical protein
MRAFPQRQPEPRPPSQGDHDRARHSPSTRYASSAWLRMTPAPVKETWPSSICCWTPVCASAGYAAFCSRTWTCAIARVELRLKGTRRQVVFLSFDGWTLTSAGVRGLLKRLGEVAQLKNVYPQKFRHAQPIYSPVLTPNGWKTMGDMRVGDRVIGVNGRQTSVAGVYPQGMQEIVRIRFSDGASVECTLDYLWTVRPSLSHCWPREGNHWRVLSTRELIDSPGPWHTPVVQPVDVNNPKRRVPIDPYTLGALLGDGHFGVSPKRGAHGTGWHGGGGLVLACAPDETEVIERIAQALPVGHAVSGKPGRYGSCRPAGSGNQPIRIKPAGARSQAGRIGRSHHD